MDRLKGSIVIRNDSGAPYVIEELVDVELSEGEELDLLDEEVANHYTVWAEANRLVTNLPTAKLHQDIQTGLIEVVQNVPPRRIGR